MDFFKILNGGIGVSMSNFDRLWAKKYSGWPETELTGLLPLSFLSKGEALTDYRIYGTANGAGVATENLWDNDEFWDNGHIFATNTVLFGYAYSVPPGTYTISTNVIDNVDTSIASVFAIATTPNQDPSISSSNDGVFVNKPRTVTVGENRALWIIIRVANGPSQNYLIWNKETFSNYWIMLTPGSTAPTSYIPYGYKIPISNTSGEQQSSYDLFIGDTQLGEEEYLDYREQKVYKRTENLFNYMAQDTENGFLGNAYLFSNGLANSSLNYNISEYIKVLPNTTYTITSCVGQSPGVCEYDSNKTYITGIAYQGAGTKTFTTTATTNYIRFSIRIMIDTEIMVVQGSTVPASYIPYLQPTDPPAPLPAINTYKGENTLSSSETVGEVSVKGKIKETT